MVTQNHKTFLSALENSQNAVWIVARWLHRRGNTVTIPPISKAPRAADWQNHTDSGDLFAQKGDQTHRIEVKQISRPFTGWHDWPFGGKFIVCAVEAYARMDPKPYAFFIVSPDCEHAAIVHGDEPQAWTTEKRTDSRYENITQDFYFAHIDSVKWVDLSPDNKNAAK